METLAARDSGKRGIGTGIAVIHGTEVGLRSLAEEFWFMAVVAGGVGTAGNVCVGGGA